VQFGSFSVVVDGQPVTPQIDNKKDNNPKDPKKTEFQEKTSFGGLLVVF